MSQHNNPNRATPVDGEPQRGPPTRYQIRLQGHLSRQWAAWFAGMTITLTITLEENGDTLLLGEVADQAALFGLLSQVRDLGIPLLSVIRLEPEQPDASEGQSGAMP